MLNHTKMEILNWIEPKDTTMIWVRHRKKDTPLIYAIEGWCGQYPALKNELRNKSHFTCGYGRYIFNAKWSCEFWDMGIWELELVSFQDL